MTGRQVLIALAIIALAATPGVWETYVAWHRHPEIRPLAVAWYVAVTILAVCLVSNGLAKEV